MIHLIAICKDVDIHIRGMLAISPEHLEKLLINHPQEFDEIVVISTCNRFEVYINSQLDKENLILLLFKALHWPNSFEQYIFYCNEEQASKHLFEVSCGFHSRILGEDQILGQVKEAYLRSKKYDVVSHELDKLFQLAISCGKEFKTSTKLYSIPVSYSSISVKEAFIRNKKNFLILGVGKMAILSLKHLAGNVSKTDCIFVAARDVVKAQNTLEEEGFTAYLSSDEIKIIDINIVKQCYALVDTIICCTSSPVPLVLKKDLPLKPFLIFDLSLPTNVESSIKDLHNVTLYNVDDLHLLDLENKDKRKNIMNDYKYILDYYLDRYKEFLVLQSIHSKIRNISDKGNHVFETRYKVYQNKKYTKDNDNLVKTLLKSTSNAYVNKAIEVLKDETLNGNGEIAYSIIKKIFNQCE